MMDADELDYDRKPMPPPPRPTSASPQSSVSKPADKPSDEKKSGGFNFPSFGGMFGAKPAAAATGAAAAAASTAALAAASAAASAAQKKQSVIQPTMTSRKPAQAAQPRGKPEGPLRGIAKRISASMPDLRKKLREAGMNNDPVAFVQGALIGTIVMGLAFTLILFMLFDLFGIDKTLLVLLFPILLIASFMWQLQLPKAKARKRAKLVDRELVFAGRQMLIELKAGVPLFDAMLSISRDYGEVSKEFAKIAERVNAGVPTDLAMHDIAEDNPSMAFKRVLLQLINSIRSGSDVASALESVLDQISREQITEMKAYGQKLNPLGMFYMIFGIIMPSLGIALAIIIFSFLSISITSTILYSVLIPVIIMQYVFLTIIESQKPDYEL
jgi:flagellar protein FlaJ